MKLADYFIDAIGEKGVDKIFVVYGAANGDLIDAFVRTDKTDYVAVMHEQGGGFAAEGYAKVKGVPGVALATSGPGGHNFVTSIGNCFYDSVPAIFITGQINAQFMRPDKSIRQIGFQETDIVSIVEPITKYAVMIKDPKDIKFELEKCFHISQSGRPGPVLIDLPMNIQKADIDPEALIGYDPVVDEGGFDYAEMDKKIDNYIDDLLESERPTLLIGNGVRLADAVDDLRELGELLKVPMFPTWNALDVVTSDYPFYGGRVGTYGGAGRNFGIQNSDLLLAIGSRISGRITGGNVSSFARSAKKYVVDIDQPMLQRHWQQVPFDVNVHADAKVFIRRMIDKLKERNIEERLSSHKSWLDKVLEWKVKYDPVKKEFYDQKEYVHPYAFVRKLSEMMTNDSVLVGDCGGNIVVNSHAFETKYGQRMLTNNGNSPMGFSFAGAMGACFAAKGPVVCTIGDGGFNMNIQEMQTLVNYGVKLKTFILNNHIYGITKAYQETNFEGRCEACGPVGYNPPNFMKLTEAYDIHAVSIKPGDDIEAKIQEVLDYDGPVVCDVDMHEHHTYEPRIFGWKTPIEDMYPYLTRDEFLNNMSIDPLEGWDDPAMPDVVNQP